MSVKLFVGGLSFSTTNEGLRAAFARYGEVASAIVMTDRATGRSRGFGFVEMATTEEAERAISGINNTMLDGRTIRVDKAAPRGTTPPRRPGGPPAGGPGGGFRPRPPSPGGGFPGAGGGGPPGGPGGFGETRGRGDSGRGARRREPEKDRKGPSRGRPIKERRAGDKGRRGDEGFRW
jgi:RNA recognition motif-containing protein